MPTIIQILDSTITNNIIAVLSLIVSVIGLIITGCTMQSAKKIQEEMERMKVSALDKSRFITYKPKAINQINKKLKSVRGTQKLSKNVCMDIAQIAAEMEGFCDILQTEDYKQVCELHKKINILSKKQTSYNDSDVTNYIDILVRLKNILEKGAYAL